MNQKEKIELAKIVAFKLKGYKYMRFSLDSVEFVLKVTSQTDERIIAESAFPLMITSVQKILCEDGTYWFILPWNSTKRYFVLTRLS